MRCLPRQPVAPNSYEVAAADLVQRYLGDAELSVSTHPGSAFRRKASQRAGNDNLAQYLVLASFELVPITSGLLVD